MYSKVKKFIFDKKFRFDILCSKNILFWKSDEEIIKKKFYYAFGEMLDLTNPTTYQEKLQWLKLNDKKEIYTCMADKYEAKAFVREKVGADYVIPTLGVWEDFDKIDFENLPNKFVLKCTHDSGGIVICKDKNKFDYKLARKKIRKSLKRNYYYVGREWPYKNIKPRIIAEPYLEDEDDAELRDYKFFTFSGVPKVMYITQGRLGNGETKADFFDMEFNHIELRMDHENSNTTLCKPMCFEKMQELAKLLSEDTPQLRVDFYQVNGKVYVGELTFFHCSGFAPVSPASWEEKMSEWLILDK